MKYYKINAKWDDVTSVAVKNIDAKNQSLTGFMRFGNEVYIASSDSQILTIISNKFEIIESELPDKLTRIMSNDCGFFGNQNLFL